MEVSLLSALTAIHAASLKVTRFIQQDPLESYHIFPNVGQDLLFIPVDPGYSLMVAGKDLADSARVLETVEAMRKLRANVQKALTHLGVTGPLAKEEEPAPAEPARTAPKKSKGKTGELADAPMDDLLKKASNRKIKAEEVNDYWDQAAQKHGNASTNPDVISYEQARKLGLLSDKDK
jgi:hypothetical protein